MLTPRTRFIDLFIAPCLVSLLFVCSPIPACAGKEACRALWVWNFAKILPSSTEQANLLQFLAAPHNHRQHAITTILVGGLTPQSLADPTTVSELKIFLRAAHARDIKVDFLCGDPSWATVHQDDAFVYVDAVIRYNRSTANPDTAFDGFQYDVEPYVLKGWPSSEIQDGWVNLMKRTNARIAASGRHLSLSCAIPFWIDSADYGYVDHGLIDNTDETFIMDYNNRADGILAFPGAEMAYASSHGKRCWIGAETNDQGDAKSTTWFAIGNKAMEAAFAKDLAEFQKQPCFAGYAIDDYSGYVMLAR